MNTLICFCSGGLGNVFLHFIYCTFLASKYHLNLVVVHGKGDWKFNYAKLFNIPSNIQYINMNELSGTYTDVIKPLLMKYEVDHFVCHDPKTPKNKELSKITNSLNIQCTLPKKIDHNFFENKNVIYTNNSLLHRKSPLDLKQYITSSGIKICDRILELCNEYDLTDTIGIHYRGTDNPKKIDIDKYCEYAMRKIPKYSKVFICSDEKKSEDRLKLCFPNHLSLTKNSYLRKRDLRIKAFRHNVICDEESSIDGFVDCLLLGKTTIFNDTTQSTFRDLGILCNEIFDFSIHNP